MYVHVLVVLKRQKNEQESVMHVQSCCFAYYTYSFFCFFFFYVLIAVASLDLKVRIVNLQIRPESFRLFLFHV